MGVLYRHRYCNVEQMMPGSLPTLQRNTLLLVMEVH